MSELTREEQVTQLIAAAFDELGGTEEQIADQLRMAGVQGKRHQADQCPLALHLARVVPEAGIVAVGDDHVWTLAAGFLPMPAPAARFAAAFDAGRYPKLDRAVTS